MRIAIDIRSLMEGRHSGVEEYTLQLLQALSRVGQRHEYVLFYNAAKPVTLPNLPSAFAIQAFRYPNKLFNAAQWAVKQPLWDSLVSADCFFVPSLRLLPLSPRTPLVTTVHDLSFERFPEFLTWKRQIWHQLMKPRALMQRSNHLITVSRATAYDVEQLYGLSANKITTIYSGVRAIEPKQYDQETQQHVRQKYSLPPTFALFLGTLEPRKNVVSIIQAYSAIASHITQDLVLAGAKGWLTKPIWQAWADSPVRGRIHLPGFIAEVDKPALYAAADVLVYPSFSEGFGFPPLEALQVRTPVITSFNSALPEIVGRWVTMVDPYSPSELAGVMHELLLKPARVSPDIPLAINQLYNWNATAQKTLQVLESVVYSS